MSLQTISVLNAMLDRPSDDWYGYELCGTAGLASGTIYPTLARLEQAGWVSSSWESVDPSAVGRPRRRFYRLTGEGAEAARRAVDEHLARLGARRSSRRRVGLAAGRLLA